MADQEATFVVALDSGPLRQGARSGTQSLEQLKTSMERLDARLKNVKASMQRLRGASSVMRFEELGKNLPKARETLQKLEQQFADVKGKFADATSDKQREGLFAKGLDLSGQIDKQKAQIKSLEDERKGLGDNAAVKAFLQQQSAAKDLESSLADLQSQYSALGGDDLPIAQADKLSELGKAADAAGGPLKSVKDKLSGIKELAAAGPVALIATALLLVAGAAIAAYVAFAKFGIAAADAARSAMILRSAAAGGSAAGLKELNDTITKIRANTAASREEASALATELYRAGLRGQNLEDAALTIERFGVLGEETKGQIKALYHEMQKPLPNGWQQMTITADMLPRDQFLALAKELGRDGNRALMQGLVVRNRSEVASALKRIGQTKFADLALQQMNSLSKLSERLKENLEDLFAGVNLNPFVGALSKIVKIFDQSTSSGKALKKISEIALGPLLSAGERLGPLLEGFFEGVTFSLLLLTLIALKARNAFNSLFPGSFLGNLDLAEVGFYAAAFVVGALVTALGALAIVLGVVAIAMALVALPFLVAGAAVVGIVYLIVKAFDSLKSINLGEIGSNLVKGLVEGIKSGAKWVADAVSGLAKAAIDGLKSKLKIFSPSKVFEAFGEFTAQGFALGVEAETPRAEKAIENLAPPPTASASSSGSGGSSGGITLVFNERSVVIEGVKDAEELESGAFLNKLAQALVTLTRQAGGPSPEAV